MKTERELKLEVALQKIVDATPANKPGEWHHHHWYLVTAREALVGEDKGRDDWMGPTRMPEAQSVNTTTADKLKEDTRAIAQSREGWDHGQCPTCERPLETRTLILCPDCDVRITPSKAAAPEPGPEKNDDTYQ